MPAPRGQSNHTGLQRYFDSLADWLDQNVGEGGKPVDLSLGQHFQSWGDDDGTAFDWLPPGEVEPFTWMLIPVANRLFVWPPGYVHYKPLNSPVYNHYPPRIEDGSGWTSLFDIADGQPPPSFQLPLTADEAYEFYLVVDPNDTEREARLYLITATQDIEQEAEVEDLPDIHIFLLAEFTTDSEGMPAHDYGDQTLHSEPTICCPPGASSGSGGSGGGSGPASGESKDTAIVPVGFYDEGYAALYVMESPNIEFVDTVGPRRLTGGRKTVVDIDYKFREVVEPETIRVVASGDLGWVGARVTGTGRQITFTTSIWPWARAKCVSYTLTGIRKGKKGTRFGKRTKAQFEANERRLRGAYEGRGDGV